MSEADSIADEQIAHWREEGVEIADALHVLGVSDEVRSWAVVHAHVKSAWLDAKGRIYSTRKSLPRAKTRQGRRNKMLNSGLKKAA